MTADQDPFASPPPDTDAATLLREGIEDARNGDRAGARLKFERVVELDDQNEKGWFWLASVVDTDEERRAALDKVLVINPNNDRARKALDALEARMEVAPPPKPAKDEEIIPGVTRRQLITIIGVGVGITVALICILITLVTVNNNAQSVAATQVAAENMAIIASQTAVAQAATQAMVDAAATQNAVATPTFAGPPTLPPTWTPSPAPTIEPTAEQVPLPLGASGILGAWGGRDLENISFLPVGVINLNAGTGFEQVGDALGRDVTLYANGQRMAYTLYDRIFFATNLQAININGANVENFGERFNSSEVIEPEMPSYTDDGASLVFVARTPTSGEARQVFLLSLVDYSVRNLTNDGVDYSYPRVSPDGNRVLVVRNDIANGTGVDLAVVEVNSGAKYAVTTDQNAILETHPRWASDGSQIVYSAALASEPDNHDLFLRNADGTGSASVLRTSGDDELFPVLSPDERFLAFASNRTGNYEIYTLDLQQQPAALGQLTNNPQEDYYPGDWWGP